MVNWQISVIFKYEQNISDSWRRERPGCLVSGPMRKAAHNHRCADIEKLLRSKSFWMLAFQGLRGDPGEPGLPGAPGLAGPPVQTSFQTSMNDYNIWSSDQTITCVCCLLQGMPGVPGLPGNKVSQLIIHHVTCHRLLMTICCCFRVRRVPVQ